MKAANTDTNEVLIDCQSLWKVFGDKSAAAEAFKSAQPELMRGVSKGVLHKNTVSRKLSRLSAAIKAL